MRVTVKLAAFTGVFAALHVVLYIIPYPLFRNWAIYIMPIEGVILGPLGGFLTALIGSTIARVVKPTVFWMFGVTAEPLGALSAGLLAKGKWKPLLAIYTIMLAAYFIHPLGRELPLWPILDVLFALALIYPVAKLSGSVFGQNVKRLSILLSLLFFVATATDSLVRIFLLIPAGLYSILIQPPEAVYYIFIGGAIDSFIEDLIAIITSLIVGVPLLTTIKKLLGLDSPLS